MKVVLLEIKNIIKEDPINYKNLNKIDFNWIEEKIQNVETLQKLKDTIIEQIDNEEWKKETEVLFRNNIGRIYDVFNTKNRLDTINADAEEQEKINSIDKFLNEIEDGLSSITKESKKIVNWILNGDINKKIDKKIKKDSDKLDDRLKKIK